MPTHYPATIVRKIREAEDITTLEFSVGLTSLPGQFVMLWLPSVGEKPFSIESPSPLRLTIKKRGQFTSQLLSLSVGSKVYIRGPYGNSFDISGSKNICIVGGGYGLAPLRFLVREAKKQKKKIVAVQGARTKDLLIKSPECRTFITTDDGSAGKKGTVLDVLPEVVDLFRIDLVCACGPEQMLKAIGDFCVSRGMKCQLSVERYMKCGIGICGHCSIGKYLCCRDGPVFSEEILKEPEFGKLWREKNGTLRPIC